MPETKTIGKITTRSIDINGDHPDVQTIVSNQENPNLAQNIYIRIRDYVNDIETDTSDNALSGNILRVSNEAVLSDPPWSDEKNYIPNPSGGNTFLPQEIEFTFEPIELLGGVQYVIEIVLGEQYVTDLATVYYRNGPKIKTYNPGGVFYSIDDSLSTNITRRDLVIGIWEVTT